MVWFIPTKKEVKKSFAKIKKHITELTSQSLNNRVLIEKNKDNILDLKEMIKVREIVREQVREPTPRTTIEKKIKQRLDNAKLMKAIHSCIKEGYSTNHIKEDIMTRFKVKKTCFFKYLKLVREQVREPTPRSSPRTLNKS